MLIHLKVDLYYKFYFLFFYMPLPEVPIHVEGSVYKAWLNRIYVGEHLLTRARVQSQRICHTWYRT